eukprot:SAG31_NODE_790_length_12082_cov_8.754319_6_plen_126_part_00
MFFKAALRVVRAPPVMRAGALFAGSSIVASGVVVAAEPMRCEGGMFSGLFSLFASTPSAVDAANKTNAAFVFIKPHAVYPAVVDLVKATFAKAGIKVTGEGTLDWKTIDSKMLIDTHVSRSSRTA